MIIIHHLKFSKNIVSYLRTEELVKYLISEHYLTKTLCGMYHLFVFWQTQAKIVY